MNMLASGFENFINGIFANWQMLLFGIAAVLLLLTIVFRKFKLTAVILALAAVGIGVVLLIDLILKAIKWDLPDLVAFLVKWVPTVLFTATVLIATLVGLKRGLRKSLILLAHEVVIAAVCIIAYVVLVKLPAVDRFVLNLVDLFMGGKGSLASALGVKTECSGIKQVFVEWLPTIISGDFAIMLGESKAYIYTLADLLYHVAFALVLYIVFLILDFIMYIVYLCCYSERKYKAKIQQKYIENKVDRRYSKHHTGGGVVGLVRGIAIGLISMSFLGTALYVVAGRGEGKLKDFDFGDKNLNQYYSVYRSIESYGTYGIFSVLNNISSTEDVPYYLFAADLVFSGELDDEEFGISDNIVFREELAAYTCFARDTMELLLKYGGDEIRPLIKGEATNGAFDTVLNVMTDEAFRAEFDDLISEFDTKTYIINFALSFVNSAIANIDDMSFAPSVSAENRELLKIMFTKGYLSDAIPDEYILKMALAGTNIQIEQPYINISKLVSKKDIQTVFNIVLDVLGQKVTTPNDVLQLVADLLPKVKSLSFLDENRAEELDPVLGRLYCYGANCYLTEEGTEGVYYSDIYYDNIEWISEINAFLNVAEGSVNLYNNVASSAKPLEAVIAIFDKDNPDYNDNIKYFDNITDCVMHSRILGKTLSTSKIYKLIEDALGNLFDGIYLPDGIVFETTYDGDGKAVTGEMYNIFNGLSAIGKNSDLLSMLDNFDKDRDMEAFLKCLSDTAVKKDEHANTIADYITRSDLLRSVISAAVINYGGEYIYVPSAAREKDAEGNPVKFIKAGELTALFDSLSELVDFILPVLQDKDADMKEALAEFIKEDVFDELLNSSTIFEGTVALHIVNALESDETVVISQPLKSDLEGWVTSGGKKGELRNLIGAFATADIDIAELINGNFDKDKITDSLTALSDADLQTCLKSNVLHYTISKFLTDESNDFGSLKLVVPEAAEQKLEGDVIPALVKKSEIGYVLKFIKNFDLSGETETDVSTVLVNLVRNKELLEKSYILSATVVRSLVDNADVNEMLNLSEKYNAAAQTENLKKLNSSNPWKTEIVRLIDALDEIMGISEAEEFVFDEKKLSASLSEFLKDMNGWSSVNENVTRLTVCYASEVVRGSITSRLDELLEGNIDEGILYGAKSGGYYSETELKSLSNVLNIFGIDIMNIEASALEDKIKTEILTLNENAEGYSGSKLSNVYPSAIFSGILSKALDEVLLNSVDEDGEPVSMIDRKVLYTVKAGSARYGEKVIADLIDAVNAFGIKDFERLDSETLDINLVIDNIENIDTICASVIMRGIFTKQIGENNTLGVDHPLAYETDIKVLKAREIKAIVGLAGNIENVGDTYFDTVSLSEIRESLFDDDGTVKSYLILSAVSKTIKESAYLIVNRDLVDKYGCVEGSEVLALCRAFSALFGGDASVSSLNEDGFVYPTEKQRIVAMQSEIVRAKLTDQLVQQNRSTGDLYAGLNNLTAFTDVKGNRCGLISKYEMNNVFDVLDLNTDGAGFTMPKIDYAALKTYKSNGWIDKMFLSDIIRFKICDYIVSRIGVQETGAVEERAYIISDLQITTKYVIDEEKTKSIIANLP